MSIVKKFSVFTLVTLTLYCTAPNLVAREMSRSQRNRTNEKSQTTHTQAARTHTDESQHEDNRYYHHGYQPEFATGAASAASIAAGNFAGDNYPVDDDGGDTTHSEEIANVENRNYELHQSDLM